MIHAQTGTLIRLCVLAVIVNAFLLLFAIPELSSRLAGSYGQNHYPDGYDLLAANLLQGNGYRFYPETAKTLMREPGYPIFLAGIFRIFGESFIVVKVANLLLALTAAVVMMRIARKMSRSYVVIFGSPVLFLLHPGTVIAESRGGIEILLSVLLALFALTLYRAIETKNSWEYVLGGVILGLSVLVKSTPLLFPLFLLAYLLVFEGQRTLRQSICRKSALMTLAMFVVLCPWIIRNFALTGYFVPTASVLGLSAHAGQYICAHLSWDSRWVDLDREAALEREKLAQELGYPFRRGYYQMFYSSNHEIDFSTYLLRRVIRQYQESPILFMRCIGSNLFNLWFAGKTWRSTSINLVVQLPYLIFAIIGSVSSVRRGQFKAVAPLMLIILYLVVVCLPILAQARYSVPMLPFLCILACVGLMAARTRCAREGQSMERFAEPAR